MKKKKRIMACIALSLSMALSVCRITPVFAATSEVGDYEEIKEAYDSLLNDMNKYTGETEAVGLLLNVYKAAVKDIKEISSDKTNETAALDTIKKSIEAKSNVNNSNSALYKEYISYIDSLIPLVKESAREQEIYNNVSNLLLNSNQALIEVISEELVDYTEEYNRITEEYAELVNSYAFVRAIGQTGEDPDGNGFVFVDGKFYRYDKDGGAYMEDSLNKVYDAYDSSGTLFSFYTEGGRLCVFDSTSDIENGWYDSTPWDYEQEVNKIQEEVGLKLESIGVDCGTIIESVPEFNSIIDSIELAINNKALESIKSPLIAFTKDFNQLKIQYAEIKEIIYSGNLNEKNIKSVDLNRIIKSMENQLAQCEQLRTTISKTLANETMSVDNELSLNNLYESLGETSQTLSKDISTFKFVNSLVGSNTEAIAKASELLKKVELLENEKNTTNTDSSQLTALKKQNSELESKINSLTSTNSSLVSKINSLTSTNSSLSSQVSSLKNQASTKAAQTTAERPVASNANTTTSKLDSNKEETKRASEKTAAATKKNDIEERSGEIVLGNASLNTDSGEEALITSATGVVSTELSADEYVFLGEDAEDGVIDSMSLDYRGYETETEGIYSEISASNPEGIEGSIGTLEDTKDNSLIIAVAIIGSATVLALGALLIIFTKRRKEMLNEMIEDEELEDIYEEDDEEESASFEANFEEHSLEGAFSQEEHMIAQMV